MTLLLITKCQNLVLIKYISGVDLFALYFPVSGQWIDQIGSGSVHTIHHFPDCFQLRQIEAGQKLLRKILCHVVM